MRTSSSRRGPVRRYLEARGVLGRFEEPHLTTWLRTSDGVLLRASYLSGPVGARSAVVLAHGFAANRRKPAYVRLACALREVSSVLTLDLRGHGGSGGSCTLGVDESRDVEAAVAWLRAFGHDRVVTIGVSMGATAVLQAVSGAAGMSVPVEGVVTVSAPGWFRDPPDTQPMQRLHAVWSSPARRRALRFGLGVKLDGPIGWAAPPHPVRLLERVTTPYLAVHGRDDPYFPPGDAHALVQAAAGPAVSWLEADGFGHAEDGFTPGFNQRLAAAIRHLEATGEFPSERPFCVLPDASCVRITLARVRSCGSSAGDALRRSADPASLHGFTCRCCPGGGIEPPLTVPNVRTRGRGSAESMPATVDVPPRP